MKYKFPKIETIDDVLPHIKDHEEIIVADRPGYTVINYVVALPETFAMKSTDDLSGAIRRECRGIMFDPSGKIIRRPFHKFFNLKEREETFPKNVNISDILHVETKLDGSMVAPAVIDGEIRFCTKMGVTDGFTSRIEHFVQNNDWVYEYSKEALSRGFTPIFEWTGPQNRIVVRYEDEDMHLLAVRDMKTGIYLTDNSFQWMHPRHFPAPESVDAFAEQTKSEKGIEGYIFVFNDGHRVKLKTEEYVLIHKTKDQISFDFYIGQHILNESLDDVKSFLDEIDLKRVEDYEQAFWEHFTYHEIRLANLFIRCQDLDRKTIATEVLKDEDAWTKGLVFKMLDGKQLRQILLDFFAKNCNGQTAHQKLMEWK